VFTRMVGAAEVGAILKVCTGWFENSWVCWGGFGGGGFCGVC
jgi:hypothetical protein